MDTFAILEIQRASNVLEALGWKLIKQELEGKDEVNITFSRKFSKGNEKKLNLPEEEAATTPA